MSRWKLAAIALALCAAVACGKSEEEKKAEQAAEDLKKATEALAQAAGQTGNAAAATGIAAAAKALESAANAMSGTGPDGKPVDPVAFAQLQTVLPEMSDWKRDEPRGERMTSPVPFSQSETSYTRGEANIDVKVVDSAFSQMLVAPWTMFLAAGFSRETSDGYEKAVTVGGNPAFERWNKDSRRGELNVVVNKRFLVTIEGDNIDNTKVLHDFAAKMDMGKLASLK